MNQTSANLPDVVGAVFESKRKQIRAYPQHTNRASEAGHPCLRYLVLSRTNWQDKVLHGAETQFIFDGGNMIEDMAIRELQDAGIEVFEQQRSFDWPAVQLTGHLDCKVRMDGGVYPVEIKGLNHMDFDKLNTIEDFHNSTKPWIRKYPAQLNLYLLNTGHDKGFFYIKNKMTYRPKVVWVDLDYEYTETIIKRLESVNEHIKNSTRPEPCNEPDLCQKCAYFHICLPDIKQVELEIINDDELEEMLLQREELAEAYKEYGELDKAVKRRLVGREKVMIGDFLITAQEIERKGYTVETMTYTKYKIMRLQT